MITVKALFVAFWGSLGFSLFKVQLSLGSSVPQQTASQVEVQVECMFSGPKHTVLLLSQLAPSDCPTHPHTPQLLFRSLQDQT